MRRLMYHTLFILETYLMQEEFQKVLLENYLLKVQNFKPEMVSRKEPELIDLDSSDDEKINEDSVVIVDVLESDIINKVKIHEVTTPLSFNSLHTDNIVDSNSKLNSPQESKSIDVTPDVATSKNPQDINEKVADIDKSIDSSSFIVESETNNSNLPSNSPPSIIDISDISDCPLNITVDTFGDSDVRFVKLVKVNSPPKSTITVRDTGNVLKDSNKQATKRKLNSENESAKDVEVVEILDDDIIVIDDSFTTCSAKDTQSRLSESEVYVVEPSSVSVPSPVPDQRDNRSTNSCTPSSSNTFSNTLLPSASQFSSVHQNLTNLSECDSSNVDKNQNPNPPKKKSKLSYHRPAHLITPLTQPTSSLPSTKTDSVSNIYNPNADSSEKRTGLRPIVIDGNNVAVGHGKGNFSLKGLKICVNFFEKRGHRQIKIFIPHYRKNRDTHDELVKMERQGLLVTTPSRKVNGKLVSSYDDRYIVQYAAEFGGVIVSTDNYRDLLSENPSWRETIEKRLLMFTWVDDLLMFPQDPLGRNGPSLDDFLKFPDS